MNFKAVEKEAQKLFTECCKLGLNSSYQSVLETMYEIASEKKQYLKCSTIAELITEDIYN